MIDFEDEEIWEDNIKGDYYVTFDCIACEACVQEAPQIFKMNVPEGHAYCCYQPKNSQEKEKSENALLYCPVNAIKNDGKEKFI